MVNCDLLLAIESLKIFTDSEVNCLNVKFVATRMRTRFCLR